MTKWYRFFCAGLALPIFFVADGASAQSKIEEGLTTALRSTTTVRAIIVMRPDPDQSLGTAAAVSSLSTTLGADANVRQIGDLSAVTADLTTNTIEQLKENPSVALVTADVPVPPTLKDSGPLIGATVAHSEGITGSGYAVAVLDTGVEINHPALKTSVVAEACFSTTHAPGVNVKSLCPGGYDVSTIPGAASQCPTDVDGCEHGTHVAGIIAGHNMVSDGATFDGIAPAAKIIAVQVFSLFRDRGSCSGKEQCILSYTSDQLRALEWVYKQRDKYKIASINMSLGGGYHDANCDQTSALTEIIERLRAKGIATVVAAGNDDYYDGLSEPACISSTISVAALDKHDKLDVSYTNVSKLVHIAAPGTAIISSVPGDKYETLSGTSMAAPHVAAAFALLRQDFPSDSVKQLESRLVTGAPVATDPRTNTGLPVLELTHAIPNSPPPADTNTTTKTVLPILLPSEAQSGTTLIIKTQTKEDNIKSILNENCKDVNCELKPIGTGTYRLDVSPHDGSTTKEISKETLNNIIVPLGPGSAAFKNGLASPLNQF